MARVADALWQARRGKIQPLVLTPPPRPIAEVREVIEKNARANVFGGCLWKWVRFEQPQHAPLAFQQPDHKAREPRVFLASAQRRKPHLPVEPRLVRRNHRRRPHYAAGFIPE